MNKAILLMLTLLTVFTVAAKQTFVVNGKDSVLILSERLSEEKIGEAKVLDYSESNKKLFDNTAYFYLNFSDEDRRVMDKMDFARIYLNSDSVFTKVNAVGDVYFKNPGINGIVKLKIEPVKQGKVIALKSNTGSFKIGMLEFAPKKPLLTNDKIVFGILMLVLAFIFYTSNLENKVWKRIYMIFPALFLCYMIPAILTSVGLISAEVSGLYHMASRYLLPASLILLILSIDIKAFLGLGSKSLIMFFTGTVGVVIGGAVAIAIFSVISPETVGGEGYNETWRGLATIAGSWIGGGANQTAMLETYKYTETLYGGMVLVDIVVANIWMAVILFGISKRAKIDKWLKADTTAIDELVVKAEAMNAQMERKASLKDYMVMFGIVFAGVALAHFGSTYLSSFFEEQYGSTNTLAGGFFWMVVISTFYGFALSLTKARAYEGIGASKFGSIFLYILVVTIGMKVDISMIFYKPLLIFVGLTWIAVHAILLFVVAKIIKAPFFFLAVGSQANIGGAASAPVVANAFHPALTTVGVLMAVFGYFIGTFGAIACAEWMRVIVS